MKKIGLRTRGWLKGFHILSAGVWIGAGICMMVLSFLKGHISNGAELRTIDMSVKVIDDFVLIPAANGCLISGIMFSAFTNWGFFKYRWITMKYIISIFSILFGTFFLGPWVNGMEKISALEGLSALQNSTYLNYAAMNRSLGLLVIIALIFVSFISVFKPWNKKEARKPKAVTN
ncbi:MAG: DUF2269 family protein [Peptococcaceae bacterium]